MLLPRFLLAAAWPIAACLATGSVMAASPAASPNPVEIGSFKDWTAYSYGNGPKKICYMTSRPKKSEPKLDKRGQPHVMVTHRPADKALNEVSVTAGFPLKADSKVIATIDKSKFEMFVKGDKAWSEKDDAKLVEAFKKGETMDVRGQPEKGAAVLDPYSLSGFGAALAAINKACNVK